MTPPGDWAHIAQLARSAQDAGLSGIVFTETDLTPWMSISAAVTAAPELQYATGVAVAFPRSPMIAAGEPSPQAWRFPNTMR